MEKLLLIDDDPSLLEVLTMYFESRLSVTTAQRGDEALARVETFVPDLILLDMVLPDGSGLDLIPKLKKWVPDTPIIVVTAHYDMETTIRAMKMGAFDYLHKPFSDPTILDQVVDRALEARRDAQRSAPPKGESAARIGDIIGTSPQMQQVLKEIGRVAASRASVLITGESGTGKELIARVIHNYSEGASFPFIGLNCSAIVDTLLESELFGHEKGAFTGAQGTKVGKFEQAEEGTIFLDEIGDMSLGLQAKLLRVLQEREFERVGGLKRIPLKARVVAATHRNLATEVSQGRFREDLFQRLKVMTIELPPLRERPSDVPALVHHLLARINEKMHRQVWTVPDEVMAHLCALPWKGNVRELENALTRAVVMAPGNSVLMGLLPKKEAPPLRPAVRAEEPEWTPTTFPSLDELERRHIIKAIELSGGHKGKACTMLGISRPTLERKLKRYQEGPEQNVRFVQND